MFKKFFQKILLTTAIGVLLMAPAALAEGILPQATAPAGNAEAVSACAKYLETHPGGNCGNYSLNDIMRVFINVSNWILGVVGSVALLFFVYGGFVFIFSGGNEEKVKQGKQILIGAIIGLVIVFASFLIIKFSSELLGAKTNEGLQINVPK